MFRQTCLAGFFWESGETETCALATSCIIQCKYDTGSLPSEVEQSPDECSYTIDNPLDFRAKRDSFPYFLVAAPFLTTSSSFLQA